MATTNTIVNSSDTVEIERSYIDNYAIKEFVKDDLIAKYFPDIDVSLRTVGMVGLTSELVSNVAEDGFNATSVLFRETFPNRAEIPESIYSHAAIFQLSNTFSSASRCTFIIVLEEDIIVKNMVKDKSSGIYYFYLGKNTKVYVEDYPYVLDYDIRIRCVKKRLDNGEDYIFSASYILDQYTNSISDIKDPYIKVRRSNNGYLALEVTMHQCTRVVNYQTIVTNTRINLPAVDVVFEGNLVGFDVLYKTSSDTGFNTQLEKRLIYSQPTSNPFCYYQLYDDNTIRLTFTSKDTAFSPEYNSELKIILYISEGEAANFDVYNGTNITMESDLEEYEYSNGFLVAARPISESAGGRNRLSMDGLQDLTVEGYRTALALATEPDLKYFFANYKYRYGNYHILFIKRRNDVYERIFGGYIVMQRDDYIYNTNTLDMHMNLSDMKNPEEGVYIIDPGTLFYYEKEDDMFIRYYRNEERYKQYYAEYEQALKEGTIPFVPPSINPEDVPHYLRRPASYAEFKRRKGYIDSLHVYDLDEDVLQELDDPIHHKFMFINPFLIRFRKNPNILTMYMTVINSKSILDFTNQNEECFVQFISYQAGIERKFTKDKHYYITTSVTPSINIDNRYPIINYDDVDGTEERKALYDFGNPYIVDQNDLRVVLVVYEEDRPLCYTEMYPIDITDNNTVVKYQADLFTDDHITSDGKLHIYDNIIWRNPLTGEYYKVQDVDATRYDRYDKDKNILESAIPVEIVSELIKTGELIKHVGCVNMTGNDRILIPMQNTYCKFVTLYRRKYSAYEQKLVLAEKEDTNNPFVKYDESFECYIWTNEYTTGSDPFDFIKPLNNVRGNLFFEDYTVTDEDGNFVYDINDVRLESIPVVRWNLAYDDDNLYYFMSSFMAQYENIESIAYERLINETIIDAKFFNTYGKSVNYFIGDDYEPLDMLNLHLAFDIWFVSGTDLVTAVPEVKRFIKTEVETVNEEYGTNQIHISNLMRKIEYAFSYVDHIRFRGINAYDTYYQSVKLRYTNMENMTKYERRKYVPEMLVVDLDDIRITEYIAD